MAPLRNTRLDQRLLSMVEQSELLMRALRAVRDLDLDAWCIGAGAIRGLVWDALHGYSVPTPMSDIDVAYFDPLVLTTTRDVELQERLSAVQPGMPWEVTNQAAVHLWFEACFGHPVPPLSSLQEALASWPEYATCVGVTLRRDGSLEVIAPHGLEDLFAMVVQHNPSRASVAAYRHRVAEKRYADRWPLVKVVLC